MALRSKLLSKNTRLSIALKNILKLLRNYFVDDNVGLCTSKTAALLKVKKIQIIQGILITLDIDKPSLYS